MNVEKVVGRPLTVSDIFTNSIFRNIVISLLATLGLYIIASLLFVSPLIWRLLRLSFNVVCASVRALAHDYFTYSIPAHGPFVHQRSQCLRGVFWRFLFHSLFLMLFVPGLLVCERSVRLIRCSRYSVLLH